MDRETQSIIANAFNNAKGYLRAIPSKRFKALQNGNYIANFDITGLHTGNTYKVGDGVIQISFAAINNKADIQREINLQLENMTLLIMKNTLK